MKIKLLLTTMLLASLGLSVNAAVSVDRTLQKDYMMNSGYSEAITESVNVGRARANGEIYYTQAEKEFAKSSNGTKFWKRVYSYIDPAQDDFSFYHHNITVTPSTDDL